MVQLLLKDFIRNNSAIDLFTFHYGSITMIITLLSVTIVEIFTFHYGSITIGC